MNKMTITPAPVRADIRVAAQPEHAFKVFTTNTARWWNPNHSIGTSPIKDVVIEPRVGGRFFERGTDHSECDWGKVLVWEPPSRLVLAWQLNGNWKYDPAVVTEVEVRFVPEGDGFTRVSLEHRKLEALGDKAEAVRAAVDSPQGWHGDLTRYAEAVKS
jgi:uncharacterized protein YndB with AHSA1/START domain